MTTTLTQIFEVLEIQADCKDTVTHLFDNYDDAKTYYDKTTTPGSTDNDNVIMYEFGEYIDNGEPSGEFTPYEVVERWRD